MKACPKMMLPLTLYAAHELDPAECADVERHLDQCASCRLELARIEQIGRMAASADSSEKADTAATEARRSRLFTTLSQRPIQTAVSAKRRAWLLQSSPLSLAMAAMLLVAFGFWLGRMNPKTSAPDATLQALLTGFEPIVEGGHSVQPELLNVQRVRYNHQTGEVEIDYNTLNGVRLTGRSDQPQVQLMLARAMVESDNPALRLHAVKAAAGIAAEQQSLDQELVQAIAYLLDKEQNQGVRLMAIRVLRVLPLTEPIKKMLLQVVLSDKNPALRMEAFDGLAIHAGGKEIEPYLQTIEKDSSSYLRYKAENLQKTLHAGQVRSAELSQE